MSSLMQRPRTAASDLLLLPITRHRLQRHGRSAAAARNPLSLPLATSPSASSISPSTTAATTSEAGTKAGGCCRHDQRRGRRRRRIPANLAGTKFAAIPIVAHRLGFSRCPDADFSSPLLVWSDLPVPVDRVTELRGHQRVNHFPGMGEISRKDSLGKNMARAARLHPEEFDFVPPTWRLPQESAQFQQYLREARQSGKKKQRVFISKPANGAMGHGIRIYKSGDQVPTAPEASSIVQLYLAKPFLVDGFKCDLRIYVLVTSCDPLRIFFYNDGLLRLGTEKYQHPHSGGDTADSLYMHLTNYSVNKRSGQYEKGSDDSTGSKRSIRFLNEYLQQRDHDVAQLWRSIIDLIIKTVLVAYPQVLLQYRMCRPGAPPGAGSVCFEILGFDIMLDHKLKPWLLEVNRSPSFGIEEPIDRKVKLGLLEEALSLLNIRLSDRRRCQAAQQAEARKRLLKSGGVGGGGGGGDQSQRRQQQATSRRREALRAQLQRLRREARLEELEASGCHRFRRVFPCDDRLRQDRYARLLLSLFADAMAGRAPALLKELEARHDPARPGPDEIADMLCQLEEESGQAKEEEEEEESHSSEDEDVDAAGYDGQDRGESGEAEEDGEFGSDCCCCRANRTPASSLWRPRERLLRSARPVAATAANNSSSSSQRRQHRSAASSSLSSRPATSIGRRLPSVQQQQQHHPATLASSGRRSLSTNSTPSKQPHQLNLDLTESAADEEAVAREFQRHLADLSIRYPGKTTAEAAEALERLRSGWKFHRPKLAAYWLASLDAGKRRQVVDIVRQSVATAAQRAGAAGRLAPLLNRLYGRLLAANGQGLWNTFSSSSAGAASAVEAGLTQSPAELLCCRRIVRLCQDCLLTVYLYSSNEMLAAAAAAAAVAVG